MKYIFSIVFLSLSLMASAQMPTPVKWDVQLHNDDSGQWVSLDANMSDNWVVYSQHMGEDGPVPTSFEYEIAGDAKTVGETEETSEVLVKYSELFEMEVKKFKHEAKFKQNLKIKGNGSITVSVTYMTCSGDKCLPPRTETFELTY